MAIHTKVGILSQIPGASASVTPGLIDGLYADFLTKEFDFLDDSRMYPQNEWFTADPMTYIGITSWEELGTNYRQWRDSYNKSQREYWDARLTKAPFVYQNFVQDPASYSNNGNGSSPIEFIRLVWPSPSGEFNIPYPNPKGSENYSLYNPSRPLKHNMTRFNLPLIDMTFSIGYVCGANWLLESSAQIRDNQTQIDAVQASINLIDNAANAINDTLRLPNYSLIEPTYNELQSLINSGADQTLIDAKQAEYDAILVLENTYIAQMSEIYAGSLTNGVTHNDFQNQIIDLQNASNWVSPDTMEGRSTMYRANRDSYLKALRDLSEGLPLSEINTNVFGVYKALTEEDLAAMKAEFLNYDFSTDNPNIWSDERYRFAWANAQNPVEGAYNENIWNGAGNGYYGQDTMTNHVEGTMPFEVLSGVTALNRIGVVDSISLLPATGNPGDIVRVKDDGDYAWDPQNQEWSAGFYNRFISIFDERMNQMKDAKLKAKDEMSHAMRPFLFANLYIPEFSLTTSTDIVK